MSHQWPTIREMLGMSDSALAKLDPVVMNLVVAQGIPSLNALDIDYYVHLADSWSADLAQRLPDLESNFWDTPEDWRNDIALFRLGVVAWYADSILGIAYKEDQRNVTRILYTNPSDLFLNGVMDSRRGTCGNLALLNVVLGRRIGLPLSLACVGSHFICRYDDGFQTHNLETTDTGRGGFSSQTDDFILAKHKLPQVAQSCGSDLQAVTPREMLGLFLGARARHLENTQRMAEAEPDYLLARYLFPRNRCLYIAQNQISVQCSMELFNPGEKGHPVELAMWLREVVRVAPWKNKKPQTDKETLDESAVDAYFSQITIGG